MKRFLSKLAGVGCVLLAGSAVASDPNRPPAPPAPDEPLVLPASIRLAAATEPVEAPDPIWLPAAKSLRTRMGNPTGLDTIRFK